MFASDSEANTNKRNSWLEFTILHALCYRLYSIPDREYNAKKLLNSYSTSTSFYIVGGYNIFDSEISEKEMNYWFTSDFHLNHWNIVKYTGRFFKSLKQMNETLIRNFNERVKENDQAYFLGDFCFKNSLGGKAGEGLPQNAEYFTRQLKCRNIIFIKGNHDRNNSLKTPIEKVVIKLGGERINLVHNPAHFDPDYNINLVGHVHQLWKFKRILTNLNKRGYTDLINVGVDVNNFHPMSFEEIIRDYSRWRREGGKNENNIRV